MEAKTWSATLRSILNKQNKKKKKKHKTTATKQHPCDSVGSSCKGAPPPPPLPSPHRSRFLGLSITRAVLRNSQKCSLNSTSLLWTIRREINTLKTSGHWMQLQHLDNWRRRMKTMLSSSPALGRNYHTVLTDGNPLLIIRGVRTYRCGNMKSYWWKYQSHRQALFDPFSMSALHSCCWALFKW